MARTKAPVQSSKPSQANQSVVSKSNNVAASKPADDVVTIDLQNFLTPLAIIISAVMISFTLFFSINNLDISTTAESNVAGAADPADTAEVIPEGFEAASITIDDDAVLGDKGTAKVAIVEFSDYECPYCVSFYTDTEQQLIDEYVSTGQAIFVYRDMPLDFHAQAMPAAIAANCARDQGGDAKYYAMHDKLLGEGVANGTADFEKYAQDLGLNVNEFKDCSASDKFADEIAGDISDGNANGCSGTPCFIVGALDEDGNVEGKRIGGAYPFADFATVIEEYL